MGVDQKLTGSPSRARWYAVQTQPRREALAMRHLQNQHFDTFCPMRRAPRRVSRHTVIAPQPFFPGYLFVSLDLECQRWRSVNGTIGVLCIVGFGERGRARPTPLPYGLVETFQELSEERSELRFREPLQGGDAVKVMGGPFDQLCGTLETAGDLERVTILLEVLSKATRVQVSRDTLIAA